ncbi:hypothetical protein SAMN05444483_105171 [Salegentibacter echinorum]|uniref:Uncharacterized protein n=1 Tax=Salegentibacter echinorum TaxID=1073325 RepID=A0A1M5HJ17_SALEC|nr:hypothetical protein [Salegentibacter echinorum]SHG15940.1 hypothetical protein SAMN05444483_105171 [Salegentibacter echinorum]
MEVIEAKPLDNTNFSYGFPIDDEKYGSLIKRENYISQIDNALNKHCELLFIEGDEDSGKTILNALYTKKHALNCISEGVISSLSRL